MRVLIDNEPFADLAPHFEPSGVWPAKWVAESPVFCDEPRVVAYRCSFNIGAEHGSRVRVHVTADERYELFLDGRRVGRGPERGDVRNWFYETYDLKPTKGRHTLVARVWWLGPNGPSPYAQLSHRPGFLLAAEGVDKELLNTGHAKWECKILGGYAWLHPELGWGTGAKVHVKGPEFDWGFERGEGDRWQPAVPLMSAADAISHNKLGIVRQVRRAILPAMLETPLHVGTARHLDDIGEANPRETPVKSQNNLADEQKQWNALLRGHSAATIPPNTRRRVIVDLENYYCAYPQLTVTGGKGSTVRVHWAESLYEKHAPKSDWIGSQPKGDRSAVEGKYFHGIGDRFDPDGGAGRVFDTLWWEAGRYVEFLIETADQPLTIDDFAIRETHYPYDLDSRFDASDARLTEVMPIMTRVLEMCSHETYMDCPYYEQLMYVGDTRLEVLTTYALTRDDRLPRKAILLFDESRTPDGLTHSRYPSRVWQFIPPFSVWWVAMVHDYAMYRGDMDFVRARMPGVRAVLDKMRNGVTADGLFVAPVGWNYMDWVPGWRHGNPPDATGKPSGPLTWQLALVLKQAADLEQMAEEPELAARNLKLARNVADAAAEAFWDEGRGLLADDLGKTAFSEHSQCLSLLSGMLPKEKRDRVADGLLNAKGLAETTIYFSHYLFETLYLLGRTDRTIERMGLWFELKQLGLKTTIEHPEPSRSDCHAWGAHPVHHYFASILGIRPVSAGFARVHVQPKLGPLQWAKGSLAHPKGAIEVDVRQRDGRTTGRIVLPDGVTGTFVDGQHVVDLRAGPQEV